MKFVLGLAAALIVGTMGMGASAVKAMDSSKSAMESGSNASDTKGAGMSKMSGASKMKSAAKRKK